MTEKQLIKLFFKSEEFKKIRGTSTVSGYSMTGVEFFIYESWKKKNGYVVTKF
jgi:hypothetical protein